MIKLDMGFSVTDCGTHKINCYRKQGAANCSPNGETLDLDREPLRALDLDSKIDGFKCRSSKTNYYLLKTKLVSY